MYSSQTRWLCTISILFLLNLALCWEIILERPEIVYVNPETNEFSISIKRINRTTTAMNVSSHFLVDVPLDARFNIDIFGFYSNTYRKLPVVIERNVCSIFEFEYNFVKDEIKGNFPSKCPIKKGYYFTRDFVPSTRYFPPIPWKTNKYCVQLTCLYKDIIQLQYRIYVRLERNDLDGTR